MFDYLTCDYPLPIPEQVEGELSVDNWAEVEFSTQSFLCSKVVDFIEMSQLETYSIESDGQIYKNNIRINYI